jgi:hypothetical protein
MPVQRPGESAQSTHAFLTSSGAALGFGAGHGCAPVVDPALGFGRRRREEGQGRCAGRQGQGCAEEAERGVDDQGVGGEGHDRQGSYREGRDGEGCGSEARRAVVCEPQGCCSADRVRTVCGAHHTPTRCGAHHARASCGANRTRTVRDGSFARRAADVGRGSKAAHPAAPS